MTPRQTPIAHAAEICITQTYASSISIRDILAAYLLTVAELRDGSGNAQTILDLDEAYRTFGTIAGILGQHVERMQYLRAMTGRMLREISRTGTLTIEPEELDEIILATDIIEHLAQAGHDALHLAAQWSAAA